MTDSQGQAGATSDVEITPAMLIAGVDALADLAEASSVGQVVAVYLAMKAAAFAVSENPDPA